MTRNKMIYREPRWAWVWILAAVALILSYAALGNSAGNNLQESAESSEDQMDESRMILVMMEQPANRLRPGQGYSAGYGNSQSHVARAKLGRKLSEKYKLTFVENWPMPAIQLDCMIFYVPDGRSLKDIAEKLSNDPSVSWAEPMDAYDVLGSEVTHKDPLYKLSPAAAQWDIARLHQKWRGDNVKIAVIDTHVDRNHPELRKSVTLSRNFSTTPISPAESHGTSVAGIIGAAANNGIGIAGIAPDSNIWALRACWHNSKYKNARCNTLSLARALNYAVENRVDIINMSLAGPTNRLLGRLIDEARTRNIAVVAAYGRPDQKGGFPASYQGVIPVSVDDGAPPQHNGYVAPGKDIPTTRTGGKLHVVQGSSFSTAHISGLLALSRERSGRRNAPWSRLKYASSRHRTIDIEKSFSDKVRR